MYGINLLIIIIFNCWLTKPQLPSVLCLEGENQAKESEAQNLANSFFSYKFDCQNQQEPTSYSKAWRLSWWLIV